MQMLVTNLRGELTIPHQNRIKDLEMFEAVARFLHLSSGEEMDDMKDVFFPSLVCSAVKVTQRLAASDPAKILPNDPFLQE